MLQDTCVQLDLSNEAHIHAFEQSFYLAFSRSKGNSLVRKLWLWNDEDSRLKTRIPYSSQRIFVTWDEAGEVDTAVAFNCSKDFYQAGFFGFERPLCSEPNYEVLAFYSKRDQKFRELRLFMWQCAVYCDQQGVSCIDATCTDRLLRPYTRVGGVLQSSMRIGCETRHLLRFSIPKFILEHQSFAHIGPCG
jgi:hypothetical protein